jgi:hypothetical protein
MVWRSLKRSFVPSSLLLMLSVLPLYTMMSSNSSLFTPLIPYPLLFAQQLRNRRSGSIVNGKCRMQLVKPQVLIHGILARTILGVPIRCATTHLLAEFPFPFAPRNDLLLIRRTIACNILQPRRLLITRRVLNNSIEQPPRIMHKHTRSRVVRLESGHHVTESLVPI